MSLRVRVMSDLHLEFRDYRPDVLSNEKDMVLVLAGDVFPLPDYRRNPDENKFYVDFFQEMCDRHRHVLYVFGNHEFYGGYFDGPQNEYDYFRDVFAKRVNRDNLVLLEKSAFVVDNVAFVGATMFTDFNDGDPLVVYDAKRIMNDYRVISAYYYDGEAYGYEKLLPETVLAYHKDAKEKVLELVRENAEEGKTVFVVLHHGAHEFSIDPRYRSGRRSEVNYCYVSKNLAYELMDAGASYLAHGHTHTSHAYTLDDKLRNVCNPHGYNDENPKFDGNYVMGV